MNYEARQGYIPPSSIDALNCRSLFCSNLPSIRRLTQATGNEVMGLQLETVFFGAIAVAYIPLTVWIIKTKHKQVTPYLITIIGSVT